MSQTQMLEFDIRFKSIKENGSLVFFHMDDYMGFLKVGTTAEQYYYLWLFMICINFLIEILSQYTPIYGLSEHAN